VEVMDAGGFTHDVEEISRHGRMARLSLTHASKRPSIGIVLL
jgi:hypothetical protein